VLAYALVSRAAAQGLEPAQETLAQLNQLIPVAERQKALTLAQAKAKQAPPPSSKPKPVKVATAKVPVVKVVRAPIKASPPPAAATVASGGWRIQLGAFSQRASAEGLYQRVSSKPALAGRMPYYVVSGAVTRLQVGPFASKAAASAACSSIGVPCFAVPGR
jgi:uncharacterized protein